MNAKKKEQLGGRRRMVEDRVDIMRGRFRVVGGRRDGQCQAIAYLGRRKVTTATDETVEDAVAAVMQSLDSHIDRSLQDRSNDVPTEAEYREALLVIDEQETEETIKLLRTHSRLSTATSTLTNLTRLSGRDKGDILSDYARVGRRIGELLAFRPDADGLDRALAPILAYAVVQVSKDGRAVSIALRSPMVAALNSEKSAHPMLWSEDT